MHSSSGKPRHFLGTFPGVFAALVLLLPRPAHSAAPAALAQAQELQQQRAARLQAMSSEQRIEFGRRLARWNALPRAVREDRRARYQAWLQLDEVERQRLREIAAEVTAFPPERRQALRTQFDALDASQRRGWRLGPTLGADYDKLQPLLAYVPQAQRLPLLASLRAMSPQQRAELAELAQRTPPQDRQALRIELLAHSGARLESWLQRKLAR